MAAAESVPVPRKKKTKRQRPKKQALPNRPAPVPLTELLRWLSDMPSALTGEPEIKKKAGVRVHAVVADLFETLTGQFPGADLTGAFIPRRGDKGERNRLRWVMAACHLLWHPAWRERGVITEHALRRLFVQDLATLAAVASADALTTDDERREELVRRALSGFGLHPPEETPVEAADRLAQVDSVARREVLAEVARRQAQLKREQELLRKAREEAASKPGRE